MKKKISNKDKKDWKKFIESNEKVVDKDFSYNNYKPSNAEKTIDLHGYSLESANITIERFINDCFSKGINKINIITGKGSRSKNKNNPYTSKDFGILKYSVPEFIKNNSDLINKIKKIDFNEVHDSSKGNFVIYLKRFKV